MVVYFYEQIFHSHYINQPIQMIVSIPGIYWFDAREGSIKPINCMAMHG